MYEVLELVKGWTQGRRGLVAHSRLTGHCQIVEDVAVLLFKRRYHRHHRFHKTRALRGMGLKAALPPEHPGSTGPLRRVVGWINLFMPDECPQGLPPLDELSTPRFGLRDATGLSHFPAHTSPLQGGISGSAPVIVLPDTIGASLEVRRWAVRRRW
jgi:hypothetical protein